MAPEDSAKGELIAKTRKGAPPKSVKTPNPKPVRGHIRPPCHHLLAPNLPEGAAL